MMLEKADLALHLSDNEYEEELPPLKERLGTLQREARFAGMPVIILFEGWFASGISEVSNEIIRSLDPRGFRFFSSQIPDSQESAHPFFWRFWRKIPPAGSISVFDRSWYTRSIIERMDPGDPVRVREQAIQEILDFEEELVSGGTLLIKCFLHISRKEQKKRISTRREDPFTWNFISAADFKRFTRYRKNLPLIEDLLSTTGTGYAPWHIIEAEDRNYAIIRTLEVIINALDEALDGRAGGIRAGLPAAGRVITPGPGEVPAIDAADLSQVLPDSTYEKRLEACGKRLRELQEELYLRRTATVIVMEGWDAAGKGGAISRLTMHLNPRGYDVIPIQAPSDVEKTYHYLYRFVKRLPEDGRITIFDRSWYGRVLVERVEGFCSTDEWKRAYHEINSLEESLSRHGTVLVKCWFHIDRDIQLKRFRDRESDPARQWKITPEDWRNREKWDSYLEAVRGMIGMTSTPCCPWTVIESNDKRFARIKTLETVIRAMELGLRWRSRDAR